VDRGSFSMEVILTLLAWRVLLPGHLHLARGNHESKGMNMIYGFEGEARPAESFLTLPCWLGHDVWLRGRCASCGLRPSPYPKGMNMIHGLEGVPERLL